MRFQQAILVSLFVQFALSFDKAAFKKQYQTAVGDPSQNAITVAATNIIEYLATTPVPTTAGAANQMVTNLISQAQSFNKSLNAAATAADALKPQLEKESQQPSSVDQQIVTNGQQMQQTSFQIQQANTQVASMQNQINVASKSVQDANCALRNAQSAVDERDKCCGNILTCFSVNCPYGNVYDARNRAQQNLASCQQQLTQSQASLAQLQAHLFQLNQQQTSLQQTKAGLKFQKAQLLQLNQALPNLNVVSTKMRSIAAHVALLGNSQVLVDVIKNLIDQEAVITPLTAISDQVINYSNVFGVNYLNILKQKIATNLPLVQQKLAQFATAPPAA